MICKKCNCSFEENVKFCPNCGVLMEFENNINFDEKFIKAYIGKKADNMYDSVKNGGISMWALLFGLLYYSYRKMYLVLFISILISILIAIFVPSIGWFFGNFIGLMFCPLYKWDITRKLRKIKNENPGISEDKLIEIAKSKGGTSLVSALLFGIIYVILLFI